MSKTNKQTKTYLSKSLKGIRKNMHKSGCSTHVHLFFPKESKFLFRIYTNKACEVGNPAKEYVPLSIFEKGGEMI